MGQRPTNPPSLTEIAVAVVEHDGRFLIGQRRGDVPLAGYWEFPGGRVASGEATLEAARRECREETGLDVVVDGKYSTVEHDYAHGKLRIHFYACHPQDPAADPRAPFGWVRREELRSFRFPPANVELVARLAAGGSSPAGA